MICFFTIGLVFDISALEMAQQQLIVNQAPPPQPLAQMNLAPQMSVQTSMPASMASLASLSSQLAPAPSYNPALQPTVQLVSQPAPGPAPPGLVPPPMPVPGPAQPPPFQAIFTPVSGSSCWCLTLTSSAFFESYDVVLIWSSWSAGPQKQ